MAYTPQRLHTAQYAIAHNGLQWFAIAHKGLQWFAIAHKSLQAQMN